MKQIPMVIVTNSQAERDILMAYNLHANRSVTKPAGLHQLMAVVRGIDEFWLAILRLPPKDATLGGT